MDLDEALRTHPCWRYLTQLFDLADTDKDGYLTQADFARLLRDLATRDCVP